MDRWIILEKKILIYLISLQYDHEWMEKLSQRLLSKINSKLKNVVRNGDPKDSYPGCINLSFAYVEGNSKFDLTFVVFTYFSFELY